MGTKKTAKKVMAKDILKARGLDAAETKEAQWYRDRGLAREELSIEMMEYIEGLEAHIARLENDGWGG